jgi:thiamine-monophosphate kinase
MKFDEIGEFGFIERINFEMINRPEGVVQGIGDDAAVFEAPPGRLLVLTTDMLVEGVHFSRDTIAPHQLGRKCLAVNLSDVAAMGAEPLDAYVSLAVPSDTDVEYVERMYDGMREMARTYSVNLLGGDTTLSPGPLVASIAVTGRVPREEVVFRKGAAPGQLVYVTCQLGDAAAGLDLIRRGVNWAPEEGGYLLKAHLDPRPHLEEGRFLARNRFPSAMMDISDGVASDLGHICRLSGVGAVLYEEAIPLSDPLLRYATEFRLDLTTLSLSMGEDYGLILTVPAERADELEMRFQGHFGRPIWRIGSITSEPGLVLVGRGGERVRLEPRGWDAFRGYSKGPGGVP